jgi:hypothetical protein
VEFSIHQSICDSILILLAEVFSVPTKKFIHYETTVWLPWFIKRYIFRQNIPRPPPIIATAEEALREKST